MLPALRRASLLYLTLLAGLGYAGDLLARPAPPHALPMLGAFFLAGALGFRLGRRAARPRRGNQPGFAGDPLDTPHMDLPTILSG